MKIPSTLFTAVEQVYTGEWGGGAPIEAMESLISHLQIAWGADRRNILRILLEMPNEVGIQNVFKELGRTGIEQLIDQELMFIGQTYAGLIDLSPEQVPSREADLLRRSLQGLQLDAQERIFILMQFLYPIGSIKAAAFNLQSTSRSNKARGLEILDNTVEIPNKRALLVMLDRNSDLEKVKGLTEIVTYEPLVPSERLRRLLELRYFLSDWAIACCFHLARQARWSITIEQTISCLKHPKGFVREAVLSYLWMASPRAMEKLLPLLRDDPDRLVLAQVQRMMHELEPAAPAAKVMTNGGSNRLDSPNQPEPETI